MPSFLGLVGSLKEHSRRARWLSERDAAPTSARIIKRFEECRELGEQRQPTSADICSSCPFGSAANWEKDATQYGYDSNEARPFACEKNGYLASVKRAKSAPAVVAPKAAMLNASQELAEFDFITLDEDCLSFFLEKQTLGKSQLEEWQQSQARLEELARLHQTWGDVTSYSQDEAGEWVETGEPAEDEGDMSLKHPRSLLELQEEHQPFQQLFALIQATLLEFELVAERPERFSQRVPLLPVLRERAAGAGLDLANLIYNCLALPPGRKFRRYAWERPYKEANRLKTPLRFARDLVEQLEQELEVEEGGDTRLWLGREAAGATITVYLPRQNVLDILGGRASHYPNHFGQAPTVSILDATAGSELGRAIPGLQEVEIRVPQPLYVIQTTNSLYTAAGLEKGQNLAKISRGIEALAQRFGVSRPVVFSRKSFNPDWARENQPALKINLPGVRYGHFERHNRGLNDFQDADLLAIVGHYSHPVDEIAARVMAFRGRKTALPAPEQYSSRRLLPYQWQGEDKKGLARWCRCHPDPEIQAAIEYSTRANLLQTIGLGRPAQRNSPLVVIFSALPVAGLPIDELTDLSDILDESRITAAQRAALDAGREKGNQARAALARIKQARLELAAQGEKHMSVGRFSRYTGLER